MSLPRPTKITQHRGIIRLMKILGYDVDERGVCFGLAHMATQTMFLGDFNKFTNRIEKIRQLHWIIDNASPEILNSLDSRELIKVLPSLIDKAYLINGYPQERLDKELKAIIKKS